jgi:transposase
VPPNEKDRIIAEQQKELQELRRANEILKEALGFFAAGRKK